MAKIEKFKDIQVWQKARELNKPNLHPLFFKLG